MRRSPRRPRLFALALGLLVSAGCSGERPSNLGPVNGSLRPCPDTPNCAHTGLRHPDGLEGMFLTTDLSPTERMERIRAAVASMPRTEVISTTDAYLHAEATSLLFRFVDDVEVLVRQDGELVVRSASRVGRGDLGVNARRVERLREAFREAGVIR